MHNQENAQLAPFWQEDLLGGRRFCEASGKPSDIDLRAEQDARAIADRILAPLLATSAHPNGRSDPRAWWREISDRLDVDIQKSVCANDGYWAKLVGVRFRDPDTAAERLRSVLAPFRLHPEDLHQQSLSPLNVALLAAVCLLLGTFVSTFVLKLATSFLANVCPANVVAGAAVGCGLLGLASLLRQNERLRLRLTMAAGIVAVGEIGWDLFSWQTFGRLTKGSRQRKFAYLAIALLLFLTGVPNKAVLRRELVESVVRRVADRLRASVMALAVYARIPDASARTDAAELSALRAKVADCEGASRSLERDLVCLWSGLRSNDKPVIQTAMDRLAGGLRLALPETEDANVWQDALAERYDVIGPIAAYDPFRILRPARTTDDGQFVKGRIQRWPVWSGGLSAYYVAEAGLEEGAGIVIAKRPAKAADGTVVKGAVRRRA